jgi:hypothetical protein
MGVDYRANFGIGVRVIVPDDVEDKEGYMEFVTKDSEYRWFQEGDENYGGEPDWYYICLREVFKNGRGYDITDDVLRLEDFCLSNNIETKGNVGLVGGLYVY